MAKSKDHSELEHLRGLVRKLKSENRQLKKVVGLSKKEIAQFEEHFVEAFDPDTTTADTTVFTRKQDEVCDKCGATMDVYDMDIRELLRCQACPNRRSRKKA